jgi:hypothetical protein
MTAAFGASGRPDPEPTPPSSGARREVLATLAIVGGLLGVVAARPLVRRLARHPSQEQCAAMLDRYAEQQALAAAPSPQASSSAPRSQDPSAHQVLEVVRCTRELTALEVDCAMKSNNADELERCLP